MLVLLRPEAEQELLEAQAWYESKALGLGFEFARAADAAVASALRNPLGYLRIESPPGDAVAALWKMMDKYEDLPMDFCDASLVYLANSLKVHRIATTDARDFSVYRLPGNQRFVHVLDD